MTEGIVPAAGLEHLCSIQSLRALRGAVLGLTALGDTPGTHRAVKWLYMASGGQGITRLLKFTWAQRFRAIC